jgi:hypothetical protein
MKKSDTKKKKIILFSLFILFLTLNSVVVEACMAIADVQAERSRCLYIYMTNVYTYGSYPNKHSEHPCGADVTIVMPPSHKNNANTYLLPYIVDSLCPQSENTTNVGIDMQTQSDNNNNTEGLSSQETILTNDTTEEFITSSENQMYWLIGRWTGMLAYLFLALSILLGVYRLVLIKCLGKDSVMRLHAVISYAALTLVLTHIIGLLYDNYAWVETLTYSNSFLPSFSNDTDIFLSLGVFSLYLMLLGVMGCILFKAAIKSVGYKTWLWGHRLTIVSYLFVYIHAWKLGTDFNMFYQILFQTLFFFIIGKYAYDYFDRRHQMSHVEPFKTVETEKLDPEAIEPISRIQYDRTLENHMVSLNGYITSNKAMYGLYWYYIYEDGITHIGAYSSSPLQLGQHTIKGVLRFFKDKPYIEIREILS